MTYRNWKLRTGRSSFIPPTVSLTIILTASAVGNFLAFFIVVFTYWYYCAMR